MKAYIFPGQGSQFPGMAKDLVENFDLAKEIMKATDTENCAVYIQATHGCCENRGIMAHSSLTQTTVLHGAFKTDASVKKEFFDNVKLQQDWAPR